MRLYFQEIAPAHLRVKENEEIINNNYNFRTTYKKLVEIFIEKKCKLITTNEQYYKLILDKRPIYCVLDYIASCGHNNTIILSSFMYRNNGILCKDCTTIEVKNNLRERHQDFIINNEANENQTIEYKSYLYIKNIIDNKFIVNKTVEGCLADFIIKPIDIKEDLWLKNTIKIY